MGAEGGALQYKPLQSVYLDNKSILLALAHIRCLCGGASCKLILAEESVAHRALAVTLLAAHHDAELPVTRRHLIG